MFRRDPGPCPVCGHAHSACTSGSGPITTSFPSIDRTETTTPFPLRMRTLQAQQAQTPTHPSGVPSAPTDDSAPVSTKEYRRPKGPR